jgi:hypothetical protein
VQNIIGSLSSSIEELEAEDYDEMAISLGLIGLTGIHYFLCKTFNMGMPYVKTKYMCSIILR